MKHHVKTLLNHYKIFIFEAIVHKKKVLNHQLV